MGKVGTVRPVKSSWLIFRDYLLSRLCAQTSEWEIFQGVIRSSDGGDVAIAGVEGR